MFLDIWNGGFWAALPHPHGSHMPSGLSGKVRSAPPPAATHIHWCRNGGRLRGFLLFPLPEAVALTRSPGNGREGIPSLLQRWMGFGSWPGSGRGEHFPPLSRWHKALVPSERRFREWRGVCTWPPASASPIPQACPTKQGSGLRPSLSHEYLAGILGQEPESLNFLCVSELKIFQTSAHAWPWRRP